MSAPLPLDLERRALPWIALVLVIGSVLVMLPFLPWVIVATWGAGLARPIHLRLTKFLGNRARLAAALTISAAAILVVPAGIWLTLLAVDAIDLIHRMMSSERAREMIRTLVSRDTSRSPSASDLVDLMMSQGGRAWAIAQQIAGTTARMVIGLVVVVAGTYAILVDGDRWYLWIEQHAPVSPPTLRRLADAFTETGRGLLVGIMGAGLAQAIVATVVFLLLGVPQPFALGLLTLGASVIPAVGTAIVWLPVAAGLAMTGHTGAAAVLSIAGVGVIGTIDNLVRPYLARRGRLQLPAYVLLVAMFSGIVVMGPWGLVVAPLVVRLAKEGLSILREHSVA